jgi:hypothetical protein
VIAVLVTLALTAGVVGVALLAGQVADQKESVYLEARSAIGASPFVRPAAGSEPATEEPSVDTAEPTGEGVDTAGTGDIATCDPARLIEYLTRHPDAAAAWVDALNSDPTLRWSGGSQVTVEQIPAYVEELTPAVLGEDSRVTNFQFVDGRARGVQSVLQGGTAVLMDGDGVPRVRCACGNPLTPMKQLTAPADYEGEPWSGFTPIQITIIVKDEDPDCDSDEYWDGDLCRPYRYCPDDMYLGDDGRCYFPKDPCPTTWERDGNGWCYDPSPEYCEDGSVKRPDKECHKPIDCPSGYERHDHKCVEPPKCPPDQDRVGDECRPKPQCPEPSTKRHGKDCVDPPKPCPDGSAKVADNECPLPPKPCPDGSAKVAGKECPAEPVDGEKCFNGELKVVGKPCRPVPPPEGEKCANGEPKVADEPCRTDQATTTCPPGQSAQDGACVACVGPPPGDCGPSSTENGPSEKKQGTEGGVAPLDPPAEKQDPATPEGSETGPKTKSKTEAPPAEAPPAEAPPAGAPPAVAPKVEAPPAAVPPVVAPKVEVPPAAAPPAAAPQKPPSVVTPKAVTPKAEALPAAAPPAVAPKVEAPPVVAPPAVPPKVVAPKVVVPASPKTVAPKAPAAVKQALTCPDKKTAPATAGGPIPATGVPAGWVQRGATMFPAPR